MKFASPTLPNCHWAAMAMALLLAACSKPTPPPPAPPQVEVSPVIGDDVAALHEFIAQAVAYDDVDLIARVSGFIVERSFEPGQMVKQGQLLLKIEPAPYEAKLEAARAVVAQRQAANDLAQIEFERQKSLLEKQAVAQDKYDRALADKRTAEADLRAAQAQLTQAELDLSYTMIAAPFDGKIGNYRYSVGNMVGPTSDPLANVVRIEPMKVRFHVNERDIADNAEQALHSAPPQIAVRVILPNGSEYAHPGHLLFLDNKVNSRTGTIMVQAEFPNPEQMLVPGQYLRAILSPVEKSPVLLVPQSAMQQDQGGAFLLVIAADSTVERRHVTTGRRHGKLIIVTEGVKAGELVITGGLQKVRPGVKVTYVAAKPETSGEATTGAPDASREEAPRDVQ